jgi:release factor glutamine methyltransferase
VYIGDLFDPFPDDLRFDVIATNPPYIPVGRTLPSSVADYEPGLALFSGVDGLDLIRRIANSARRRLTEKGVLWCECDSAYAETARALFEAEGLNATIRTDQYGEPRVIIARLI